MINKLDFNAKNLTSNAGIFLLLEEARNIGIFDMIENDLNFDMLKDQVGENEYLIEAYFTNSKEATNFQTAYENAGLPQNGQAVTYAIIFLLSALTDITTVFVLLSYIAIFLFILSKSSFRLFIIIILDI